jgi:hypothetical protein
MGLLDHRDDGMGAEPLQAVRPLHGGWPPDPDDCWLRVIRTRIGKADRAESRPAHGDPGQGHLAETVKPRFSRTASGTYLANGCEHCGSIQGDCPIGRMISEWGFAAPLTELPILATATVARAVRQDVLARQGMKRLGDPMKWEDLD